MRTFCPVHRKSQGTFNQLLLGCMIPAFIMLNGCMIKDPSLPQLTQPISNSASSKLKSSAHDWLTHLTFTSGSWQGNTWKHELLTVTPESASHSSTGILLIDNEQPALGQLELMKSIAMRTNLPVSVISSIPNQPIFERREGDLMAYSFKQYLETKQPNWPLLVPMVRSVRTAMDLLSARTPLRRFILIGSSKRAWTALLTGASDPRVAAIAALAFNALNFRAQFKHVQQHEQAELEVYRALGLLSDTPSANLASLYDLVDPYSYRSSLKVPIYFIVGTNDPYWNITAAQHFIADLPQASLLMAPNTGHDPLSSAGVQESLLTWILLHAQSNQVEPNISSTTWIANSSDCTFTTAIWAQQSPSIKAKDTCSAELTIVSKHYPFGTFKISDIPSIKNF